ncbi:MAG TPA: MFS transporter, partial [Candidatus Aenigmarchaeota archaeon]|nr:MFS transporter [Candidatus Aenigmarchaeota archaeon]
NFKIFLLSTALFSLSFFSYSFLLVFARDFGFEPALIPVLYLTFTLFASLFSLPFGKLADKTSRKFVLIISIIFFQLVCLGFILADSLPFIYFLFIIYGLHLGARVPVQKAFVSELVPARYRASALGIFQLVAGLCLLPSSLIAGILWTIYGRTAPFIFSLILSSLSLITLLLVKER